MKNNYTFIWLDNSGDIGFSTVAAENQKIAMDNVDYDFEVDSNSLIDMIEWSEEYASNTKDWKTIRDRYWRHIENNLPESDMLEIVKMIASFKKDREIRETIKMVERYIKNN